MLGTLIESITFIHYTPTPITMKRFTPKTKTKTTLQTKNLKVSPTAKCQLSSATSHDHFYHCDADENIDKKSPTRLKTTPFATKTNPRIIISTTRIPHTPSNGHN